MMQQNTKSLTINCDGGSRGNPGPSAWAYVVYDSDKKIIHSDSGYLGKNTNNVAEYQSLIECLKWLKDNEKKLEAKSIQIVMDSQLVVKQIAGEFRVKAANLVGLFMQASALLKSLEHLDVTMRHVLRNENFSADELVNKSLDQHTM